MNEAQLVGVTPYFLRLAAYYCAMGIGAYDPKGYTQFDHVTVRELMPWKPGATPTESTTVLIVEFYYLTERIRYVEFALRPAGFGGQPIVKLLPSDNESAQKNASGK